LIETIAVHIFNPRCNCNANPKHRKIQAVALKSRNCKKMMKIIAAASLFSKVISSASLIQEASEITTTPTTTPTMLVNHVCKNNDGIKKEDRNKFHFRGTALGGWLVLEPWITPSLFYQFLGVSEKWGLDAASHVGLDSYTFCTGES
jgi:hypothetical protein